MRVHDQRQSASRKFQTQPRVLLIGHKKPLIIWINGLALWKIFLAARYIRGWCNARPTHSHITSVSRAHEPHRRNAIKSPSGESTVDLNILQPHSWITLMSSDYNLLRSPRILRKTRGSRQFSHIGRTSASQLCIQPRIRQFALFLYVYIHICACVRARVCTY
jgi:hypothetical protein